MPRWTVEFDGGGHIEVDARSERDARRLVHNPYGYRCIIEVRPFAAKPKVPRAGRMPVITVKPDPFDMLRVLLPGGGA